MERSPPRDPRRVSPQIFYDRIGTSHSHISNNADITTEPLDGPYASTVEQLLFQNYDMMSSMRQQPLSSKRAKRPQTSTPGKLTLNRPNSHRRLVLVKKLNQPLQESGIITATQRQSRNHHPVMHLTETNSFHKLTNIFDHTSPLEDVYLKTSGSEVYTANKVQQDKSPLTLKRYKHLFKK